MIQVAAPDISAAEIEAVTKAITSGWIAQGEFVREAEHHIAAAFRVGHAVTTSSGTTALHAALMALRIREGDEVIVPSLTYVASVAAVRYVGARPVFVDVSPDTWTMDPSEVEAAITPRTRAIVAVHLYGHPVDMDPINYLAYVHGLDVVEDAAEAHFARYRGQLVGTLGRVGVLSFYANKILAAGEGGAVLTDDERLAAHVSVLCGQGQDPSVRYHHPVLGYNYRMNNLSAAVLSAQLDRLPELLRKRRRIFDLYTTSLENVEGLTMQPVADWAHPAPWLFSVLLDGRAERDDLAGYLAENAVQTRPFFRPIHQMAPFREFGRSLPVTEELSGRGINLPTHTLLSDEDIHTVSRLVQAWAKER